MEEFDFRANPDDDDEFIIIKNGKEVGMLTAQLAGGWPGQLTWFSADNNGCAKGPYDSWEQAVEELKAA